MASSAHASAFTGDVNDWALTTYEFGPFAAASFVSGTTYPLLLLPEACDIEKISVRISAGSSGVATFGVAASGTAAPSTAITAAETITVAALGGTADTTRDLPFLSTAPQIDLPSGTLVYVTSSGTITALAGFMIQIVTRKKPARRDYTSDTTKVDKTKYFYTKN